MNTQEENPPTRADTSAMDNPGEEGINEEQSMG